MSRRAQQQQLSIGLERRVLFASLVFYFY